MRWVILTAVLLVPGAVALAPNALVLEPARIKWALAQVETGPTREGQCRADYVRGKRLEVSRYQVLPALWHRRTSSKDYANPAMAWQVTQAILAERVAWFRAATGREPDAFDIYVMWNAPGHYQAVGFQPRRVSRAVASRARRFDNLVEAASPHRFCRQRPAILNVSAVAVLTNTNQTNTSID